MAWTMDGMGWGRKVDNEKIQIWLLQDSDEPADFCRWR